MTNITTAEVVDKYGEKVTQALQVLSAKLGVAADHFWPVLVNYQTSYATIGLIGTILSISVLLVCIYYFGKFDGFDEENWQNIMSFIGIIIFGIISIILLGNTFMSFLPMFFNPEYYALMEVMRLIK